MKDLIFNIEIHTLNTFFIVVFFHLEMCDVITDTFPVIPATDSYSEKEMLAQGSNDDEQNKDGTPEVLEKPDTSEISKLIFSIM